MADTTWSNLTPAQRLMTVQMGSLKPEAYTNFNAITNKYPGMSKDLVMSMVRQGYTVDTPGLSKMTTIDGLSALKADTAALAKLKTSVTPDRGVLGTIQNTFQNAVYDPFKGVTRLVFAGLRSFYDGGTTLYRDAYAMQKGEAGAGGQFIKDLSALGGTLSESSTLGQMVRSGNSGTGSGFFVTPESKVGKAQAKAMGSYGKINGESFTIGRQIFNGVGMNPNSNAYHIASGILDATLNFASDPSTWVGPGAVGKLITQGKTVTKLTKELTDLTKTGFDNMAKESLDELEKSNQIIKDTINKKISSPYKRYSTKYKKLEQDIIATETKITNAQINTFQKLLNTEKNIYAWEGVDKAAEAALSPRALTQWFIENPKVHTGEMTKAISLLGSDLKNTGGFFDGFVMLDELPQVGKISVGVHSIDEYAVTLKAGKELKMLDMGDTFVNATEKVRITENLNRAKFADALDKLAKGASEEDFRVLSDLSSQLRQDMSNLDGYVGSLFASGNELVAGKSLGSLIGDIAQYKNASVMAKVSDLVQKIWKVDGFTNVRSIYGGTGGVVVTNTQRLAAKSAQFGNAAAEVLDPTNLGPNILKLLGSVKGSKEELARRQNQLDDILNSQIDLKDKEEWFKTLRQKAHEDPEMLQALIQDPANAGIKNLLKMELEITNNNVYKESIRAQMGITDNFMGEVLDTPNAEKALKFILGREFAPIADMISKETDAVKLRRLFNRKLDDNMIKELTDATNKDEVFKVFLNQFVPGGDVLKIKQALSVGAKIATSPVARLVPGVNMNAIRYAENINKAFGRFYIRSTALNLNDLTGLNNGIEDWMSSAGLKRMMTKGAQERIITETQQAIFRATTNGERAKAVATGIDKMIEEVGKRITLTDDEVKILKGVTKLSGSEQVLHEAYSLSSVLGNKGSGLIVAGGKNVRLEKGILESQLVKDVINLPDTRKFNKVVSGYNANVSIFGKGKAFKVMLEETGDLWRTAQLVGRFSYIVRNIAEMQMRQFFSGHYSLFNSPVGFISMMIANPEGNAFQRALVKNSRYGVNALGDYVKSVDAEIELSASIIARRGLMRGTSVGDYGKAGRAGTVFKAYEAITPEHPDFLKGLAWTMNNYSSDKFMPDVVRLMQKANPEAQSAYVDDLIDTFDTPGNKLKEFASAIFDDNEGMREILLKNPGLESGPGVVADNMNKENILIWLFDAKQPDSVAGQLNLLGGQGEQRNLIMDLIRDGEVSVMTSKGKMIKIKTPYRQKGLTTEQVLASERAFEKQVATLFKPEQLADSAVINMTEKVMHEGSTRIAKEWTDKFFNLAARMESAVNFGPEFDAAYWDHIAGYADMLSTAELTTLRNNANKAFAPRGKILLGRVPAPLRTINTTLKNRLKNPDYVHKGGTTLKTLDGMASDQASNYVKNLFYDAAKQKQWANAARLVAPFAQAQYNTINKWGQLTWSNPVPIYKFGKAFDSLTKEGTNVIYDTTGMTYDDNKGFLYQDDQSGQLRFKMPLVGSVLGAMAGQNLNMKDALQITSPVASLNLAFGAINPMVPGIGPAIVASYELTGRAHAFGPVDSIVRDIITPFGAPKTVGDIIFPAWFKKTSAAILGDDASTQRGIKDWASYLASTGNYGNNPLATDATRIKLFNDASQVSKWANLFGGLLQSISPATPTQEILVKIKNPNNKMNFMTMTMLYDQLKKLKDKYPGDSGAAVAKFAEQFGINNVLVAVSGTTPGSSGTEDAWNFLNNNPSAVNKYARPNEDVVPFFFPGGEYSLKYYNWQKTSGARRSLSTADIQSEAEGMVYSMLKSQIAEKQVAGLYTQDWYVEQIAILNKQFGGAKPIDTLVTGISDARIAVIERALQDPAMQASPVYKQISEFYPLYKQFKDSLDAVKVSNYAELSSKGGLPTLMRNELVALGEKLMTENPEFTRMYYGVFAGILKETK